MPNKSMMPWTFEKCNYGVWVAADGRRGKLKEIRQIVQMWEDVGDRFWLRSYEPRVQAVVLQVIWRKYLHAIWRTLNACKRWAGCPLRVGILLCSDSG